MIQEIWNGLMKQQLLGRGSLRFVEEELRQMDRYPQVFSTGRQPGMVLRIVVPVSLQGIGALADGTSTRRGKSCHTFLFECLASQVYSAGLER